MDTFFLKKNIDTLSFIQNKEKSVSLKTMEDGQVMLYSVSLARVGIYSNLIYGYGASFCNSLLHQL